MNDRRSRPSQRAASGKPSFVIWLDRSEPPRSAAYLHPGHLEVAVSIECAQAGDKHPAALIGIQIGRIEHIAHELAAHGLLPAEAVDVVPVSDRSGAGHDGLDVRIGVLGDVRYPELRPTRAPR